MSRASVTPPAAAAPAPVTVTRQSAPPVSQPYSTARASANWTLDALAHSMASVASSLWPADGNCFERVSAPLLDAIECRAAAAHHFVVGDADDVNPNVA